MGSGGVDNSLMARTIRLNFLAPAIVEAILDGSYPDTIMVSPR